MGQSEVRISGGIGGKSSDRMLDIQHGELARKMGRNHFKMTDVLHFLETA